MPRKLVEAIMHNWNFDAGSIATETAATMTLSGRLTIPHTEAPPSFLFVVYLRPRGAGYIATEDKDREKVFMPRLQSEDPERLKVFVQVGLYFSAGVLDLLCSDGYQLSYVVSWHCPEMPQSSRLDWIAYLQSVWQASISSSNTPYLPLLDSKTRHLRFHHRFFACSTLLYWAT